MAGVGNPGQGVDGAVCGLLSARESVLERTCGFNDRSHAIQLIGASLQYGVAEQVPVGASGFALAPSQVLERPTARNL